MLVDDGLEIIRLTRSAAVCTGPVTLRPVSGIRSFIGGRFLYYFTCCGMGQSCTDCFHK